MALRKHDLRPLQVALMPWGLSSLGRLESRVEPALDGLIATVGRLAEADPASLPPRPPIEHFFDGERELRGRKVEVFGPEHRHRRVRIMVTLAADAADDAPAVTDLVGRGADCFRINCAHDDAATWERMLANIRLAQREVGRSVQVVMDIGGQKPRMLDVLLADPPRRLQRGDRLLLTPGPPAVNDGVQFSARCSVPGVLAQLAPGSMVTIDDGRTATEVAECGPQGAELVITRTRPKGLRACAQSWV